MDVIKVEGGAKLHGTVHVDGAGRLSPQQCA